MTESALTVIAANYNNQNFIKEFITSIYNSTVLPAAVIVTDDGSTDGSVEILKELEEQYPSLRVIYFAENRGVAHARNAAIEEVETLYTAIADIDDIFNKQRIDLQLKFLQANDDIDFVGSNCDYILANQSKKFSSNFPLDHVAILEEFKSGRNGLLNGTVTGKTNLLKEYPYQQDTVWAEDYDLFSRLICGGYKFSALADCLMKVRIHQNSQTSNLKLETIQKIYQLREKHFGISYQEKDYQKEYLHLLNYRNYLSESTFKKYYYLLTAAWYAPEKILKRFKSYVS